MRKPHFFTAAILCGLGIVFSAYGQVTESDYPSRPIRLIVPLSPGGLVDTFARSVAQHFSERLAQPVVVENRPGASQAIAAEALARSAPDGYTLLLGTQSGIVSTTVLRKTLPYDPLRDFATISILFESPLYLVVHPSVPAHSVAELIKLARAQPGQLSFASIGTGTAPHIGGALFMKMTGSEFLHVPYKGSSQAIADLLSGQVQMMFEGGVSSLPHARAGKLRALATTAARRTGAMPALPTVAEAGVPGYEVNTWFGLMTNAAVPRPIIDRLNREAGEMLKLPATHEKFKAAGIELMPSTPEAFAERIRAEIPQWTRIMREIGIQPE
jgi:tripartite-type tricarboxylate transporter receptor subunit TctC